MAQNTQTTFALIRSQVLQDDQIGDLVSQIFPQRKPETPAALKVSELFAAYIDDKSPHWSDKTHTEYLNHFSLLVRILGDRDITSLKRSDFTNCRDILIKLPTNLNKKKQYRGLPIAELVETAGNKMHPKTVNKHLILLSSAFKWAIRNEHATTNLAEGLLIPTTSKADEERIPYNNEEIAAITTLLPNDPAEGSEPLHWIR